MDILFIDYKSAYKKVVKEKLYDSLIEKLGLAVAIFQIIIIILIIVNAFFIIMFYTITNQIFGFIIF